MSGRLERLKLEYQRELHKLNNIANSVILVITISFGAITALFFNSEELSNLNKFLLLVIFVVIVACLLIKTYTATNTRLTELAKKLECEK